MNKRQLKFYITFGTLLLSLLYGAYVSLQTPTATKPSDANVLAAENSTEYATVTVTRVVDGDTIHVRIEGATDEQDLDEKVRLIGIDTPESVDPRRPVECFGKEAGNRLKALIAGKEVELQADASQSNRDKYNRLLRYVYLDDVLINKLLIEEGFANEYTYDEPYMFQSEFKAAEQQASAYGKGLWSETACVSQ